MVRSLYARSKLEKYHESTNVYRQKDLFTQGESQAMGQSRDKNEASKVGSSSLLSREKRFALTTKRVCAHDKKGLRSRQKRFHLTSANSPLGFSLFHCLCSCARFRDFCLLIQALSALKDQPLGVVCDEKNAKFYLERAKDYADKGISGGG